MNRYVGKPLLRLLECYVLDAIAQLDDRQREVLHRMEPKLAAVYGTDGTWREITASQMNFPESLPGKIWDIWARNLDDARRRGQAVDPNEFAMAFVDQNFAAAVAE